MVRPKIAFLGTGGTMSALDPDPLELLNYNGGRLLSSSEIVASVPALAEIAEVVTVDMPPMISTAIGFAEWRRLAADCAHLAANHPDLAGIVIGHGTATLEETAYFLNLVLKLPLPVVLVGAQRPASAVASDYAMNLINAVRVAGDPASGGRGVLVVLNDEIQAAREVTKTATYRLQTFRSADFGILGYVDGPVVRYYRRTERRHAPNTEFDVAGLATLPRVDIAFSHADADGVAIDAFVTAGARGIVSAGFAPGLPTSAQMEALSRAADRGVILVQSTRAGSGIVHDTAPLLAKRMIGADNLIPQKARILLALALTVTQKADDIRRIFATY